MRLTNFRELAKVKDQFPEVNQFFQDICIRKEKALRSIRRQLTAEMQELVFNEDFKILEMNLNTIFSREMAYIREYCLEEHRQNPYSEIMNPTALVGLYLLLSDNEAYYSKTPAL